MNERNEGLGIDLQKLLMAYLHKWWLILLAAVLMAGAALAYTYYCVTDLYQAYTTIYVNNVKEGEKVESVSTGNLSASTRLVSTYINIVKSDRVMDKVSSELKGDYSTAALKGMVSAQQVGATEIFAIYVTGPVPEESARIANVLADVVPEEIGALIEGSSARVIDTAKVPSARYSPSYQKNTLLGGLIGAVIVLAYLTLRFLLDVRIKDEEELAALFGLPVLGQIPEFVSAVKAPTYYSVDTKEERTAAAKTENQQEEGEEK